MLSNMGVTNYITHANNFRHAYPVPKAPIEDGVWGRELLYILTLA